VGEFLWDLPEEPKRLAHLTAELCEERMRAQIEEFGLFGADQRVGVAVMVVGMGTCSDGLLKAAKRLADEHDCMCYLHQSYGNPERDAYVRDVTGGVKPMFHFANLGILGPNVALIHANYIDDDELEVLVDSGACCIHNPAASLKVGLGASHHSRFPEMLERGVRVALGSDSSNWSNFFDINMQIYLAAVIHREARMKTPTITAEQAIEMATVNAAHVLGIPDLVGALESGRRADIVMYNRERPEWHPQLDLVNCLVYAGQSKGIDSVIINGEVVLRKGRFTKFDQDALYQEIDRQARSVATRLGFPRLRWPHIQ
jgi:cytosine/adenosine deaminase-related metal-dependent hydrolase